MVRTTLAIRVATRVGALTLVLVLSASAVSGQYVTGRVRDEATGAPIVGALVKLMTQQHASVGQALTDSIGRFAIKAPRPGRYYYHVERLGYATTATPSWMVNDGEELSVEVMLAANAVSLLPLTVIARRRTSSAGLQSFEERANVQRKLGLGKVYGPEELEFFRGSPMADFLMMVPGLSVTTQRGSIQVAARRAMNSMSGACAIAVYIDGMRVGDGPQRLAEYNISDVHGIEVYRSAAEVPGEFAGSTAGCGVIAVWTRRR